ncbi:MAG TPA: hypothetical protein VKE22_18015 [Haliangiales bacterium]|nr:hypothetical protein [Haliangiales bacterium]
MRLFLLAALCTACGAPAPPGAAPPPPAAVDRSQTAPRTPLLAPFWSDQPAVIVFCDARSPLLDEIQRRLKDFEKAGAWVAAVTADAPGKPRPFPVVHDRGGETARAWGATALPAGFVVVPGGRIVYRGGADVDDLLAALRK